MSRCYLCAKEDCSSVIYHGVKGSPDTDVLQCCNCGLVYLSSFDHITDDFYPEAKMCDETMEEWLESTEVDDKRRLKHFISCAPINGNKACKVLDFGAGTCNFLFELKKYQTSHSGTRDFHLYAVEPEKRVYESMKDRLATSQIKLFGSLSELNLLLPGKKFDVITMYHSIEHLPDPISTLKTLHSMLNDDGIIIIETPNSNDALLSMYDCDEFKKFSYWVCHLFLFCESTLRSVAEYAGFSRNNRAVSQIQRYPLSNHMYWLAHGKPNGHRQWSSLNSRDLSEAYENKLHDLGRCDTLVAVLGGKP